MAGADVIPWWGWVLLWTVLVLGALTLLGVLVYRLVRQGLVVLAEAGAAGARLGELAAQVEALPPVPRTPPAVLEDPARLRAERRERQQRARRARARVVAARRRARGAPAPRPRGAQHQQVPAPTMGATATTGGPS